ncbi:MAG: FIST N-terminal domain-containing protein [Candidatus Omnitrophota bacterium]
MPLDIGIGLSTEKDYSLAAKEAVKMASMDMVSEKVDMAIVFSSRDLASIGLLKSIALSTGGVPLIGCSATALLTPHGIIKHGVAVVLLSIPETIQTTIACIQELKNKRGSESGRELADRLLADFKETRRVMGLVFSDSSTEDAANLIAGMRERLGKMFPILVGSLSGNRQPHRTYLYFNHNVLMDSALGMLWGGRLNFGMGSCHGWKPLGKPRTVTKSQANIVEEIDGEYALKIYEEYFGASVSELRKNFRIISMLYPLGISIDSEKEYLLRNAVAIEENGSLRFQADIKQGSIVKLMLATKESCFEATRRAAEEAKRNLAGLSNESAKTLNKRIVFVFESLSRQMLLNKDSAQEIKIIKDAFGPDTPLIGLYTYGGQAPLNLGSYYSDQSHFHNQAISILALGG